MGYKKLHCMRLRSKLSDGVKAGSAESAEMTVLTQ